MKWLAAVVMASSIVIAPSASAIDCPGDVNGDGTVGFPDLVTVLGDWGPCTGCDADLDGNGLVGFSDLLIVLTDWDCVASTGPSTTLSGHVTNLWTGDPIEGATVTVGDDVLLTGMDGVYSGEVTIGLVTVEIDALNYNGSEETLVLFPDLPTTLDVALEPVAPVVVSVVVDGDTGFGGIATATAIVDILDGSTLSGFEWAQVAGAEAMLLDTETDMVTVELGEIEDYKAELIHVLSEPPIDAADLPEGVPLPPGEFPGGLQDRFQVVGINPFALENAGLVELEVAVTTSSGVYTADGEVHTGLPWKPSAGIRTVPLGVPILLHGKEQASYDWSLMRPAGSAAVLNDPAGQSPDFTPDVAGIYTVTVTDQGAGAPVELEIFVGNWRGIIIGQDAEGNPISETTCTGCHTNLGADQFTPWSQTGHARILQQNLDTSTHYGPQCFSCHSVGYDLDAVNGGMDDAPDYLAFLDSGLINNPGDNWTAMLAAFPVAARLSNVQCESCHGPQWGLTGVTIGSHGPLNPEGTPRMSLSADVCATCHGEPLRHARFQQWQLSGHANYDVAIDEGDSGSCSRCHTANGFLAWLPILTGDEPGDPLDDIEVTWSIDEVHPQTCVTCHDPHMAGTMSGNDNDATVRISGQTPPLIAGFTAFGVGRGAICMTCHNSRRGLRNDSVWDDYAMTSEAARAPHGSAQTDMLMGQNAYLVTAGIRGGHSFVTDTCTQCHMERTPPPDILSYNNSGTNHTFYARLDICSECHGDAVEGEFIQEGVQQTLDFLQDRIEDAIVGLFDDQIALGNSIDLNGAAMVTDVDDIAEVIFSEFRGGQAITVVFLDQTTVGPVRMSDVDVRDAGMANLGQVYDFADEALPKAGWNWALVTNDGSLGVHNPTFAFTALDAAIAALQQIPGPLPPSADWPSLVRPGYGARRSMY